MSCFFLPRPGKKRGILPEQKPAILKAIDLGISRSPLKHLLMRTYSPDHFGTLLPLMEEAQLMQDSALLIGQHGSNMVSIVFMGVGTPVVEVVPRGAGSMNTQERKTMADWAELALLCGSPYWLVTAEGHYYSPMRFLENDLNELSTAIEQALELFAGSDFGDYVSRYQLILGQCSSDE